jgi:hypothetical protein
MVSGLLRRICTTLEWSEETGVEPYSSTISAARSKKYRARGKILRILFNTAILWVILHFIVDEHSVPSFKPLIILLLFCSLIGFILSLLLETWFY